MFKKILLIAFLLLSNSVYASYWGMDIRKTSLSDIKSIFMVEMNQDVHKASNIIDLYSLEFKNKSSATNFLKKYKEIYVVINKRTDKLEAILLTVRDNYDLKIDSLLETKIFKQNNLKYKKSEDGGDVYYDDKMNVIVLHNDNSSIDGILITSINGFFYLALIADYIDI